MQSLRNLLAPAPAVAGYAPLSQTAAAASPLLSAMSQHAAALRPADADADADAPPAPASAPLLSRAPLQYLPLAATQRARARARRPVLVRTAGTLLALLGVLGTSYLVLVYTWTDDVARLAAAPSRPALVLGVDTGAPSRVVAEAAGAFVLDDQTHVLVPLAPPAAPPLLGPLSTRPPLDHLLAFYIEGRLADAPAPPLHPLDVVYLYVNASSPYFAAAKEAKEAEEGVAVRGKSKHWRDNGELRGAVRSAVLGLGDGVRTVHVVSAAFEVNLERVVDEDDEEEIEAEVEAEVGGDEAAQRGDSQPVNASRRRPRRSREDAALAVERRDAGDSDSLDGEADSEDDGAAGPDDAVDTADGKDASALELEPDIWTTRRWAMGQVPSWLAWNQSARLEWHFHPDIYALPRDDDGRLPPTIAHVDEEAWQREALPTFNSFEIESRIPFMRGLAEHYVASNDDMFVLRHMSVTDFHHPLLGAVIRLDPSPGLSVRPEVTPDLRSTPGEWGGLQHANVMLSARFPRRPRMYMHHVPKAQTLAVAHEASVMFAEALTASSARAFRESEKGDADVEMAWLVTHTRVERWREALLWAWAVARLGGQDGTWGTGARDEVRQVFGLQDGVEGDVIRVVKGERKTLDDMRDIMRDAGWAEPTSTEYTFSSFDGHLPMRPDVRDAPESCEISLKQCFDERFFTSPSTSLSATAMFTRLAFELPGCGDCLINALVTASGPRGLSAVLPHARQAFVPPRDDGERAAAVRHARRKAAGRAERPMWRRAEPMLPLAPTWREADFSLAANVRLGQDAWAGFEPAEGEVDLRAWAVKLLSRYAYTFGNTPSRFTMIHGPYQLTRDLLAMDNDEALALACVNDDVADSGNALVPARFAEWMQRRWGGEHAAVDWERAGWPWL